MGNKKRTNLFLYVTLACFLAIIAIFIFDGYVGVYDSVTVLANEQTYRSDADSWAERDNSFWVPSMGRAEKVGFTYEVDNRTFSTYQATVAVSVWRAQDKIADIASESVTVTSFSNGTIEWVIDIAQTIPEQSALDDPFSFTVLITRDGVERRVIINVRPEALPSPPIIRK